MCVSPKIFPTFFMMLGDLPYHVMTWCDGKNHSVITWSYSVKRCDIPVSYDTQSLTHHKGIHPIRSELIWCCVIFPLVPSRTPQIPTWHRPRHVAVQGSKHHPGKAETGISQCLSKGRNTTEILGCPGSYKKVTKLVIAPIYPFVSRL